MRIRRKPKGRRPVVISPTIKQGEVVIKAGDVSLDDFCEAAKSKPRKRKSNAPALKKALDEVAEMRTRYQKRDKGAFDNAEPKHLVALYAHLHEHVYGVPPLELKDVFMFAVAAARKMLREEFDDEPARMVVFLKWAWVRERGRHKWRQKNDREMSRIGWQFQFARRELAVDYRVHLSKKKGED